MLEQLSNLRTNFKENFHTSVQKQLPNLSPHALTLDITIRICKYLYKNNLKWMNRESTNHIESNSTLNIIIEKIKYNFLT